MSRDEVRGDTLRGPAEAHLREFLADHEARLRGEFAGRLFSGLADLDELLGGLRAGELVLFGGRPAAGTTTLALTLLRSETVYFGGAAAYTAPRLSPSGVVARMVSALGRLSIRELEGGSLTLQEERGPLREACEMLADARFHLSTLPVTRLDALREEWSAWARANDGGGLLIYDGLQHLEPGDEQVGRALRGLAEELQAAVVALVPLHRSAEGAVPSLRDLWGGLDLELQASKIVLLQRPGASCPDARLPEGCEPLTAHVVKNEAGATGVVPLAFDPRCLRIESASFVNGAGPRPEPR